MGKRTTEKEIRVQGRNQIYSVRPRQHRLDDLTTELQESQVVYRVSHSGLRARQKVVIGYL